VHARRRGKPLGLFKYGDLDGGLSASGGQQRLALAQKTPDRREAKRGSVGL